MATPWPKIRSQTSNGRPIYTSFMQGIHIPWDGQSTATRVPIRVITAEDPSTSARHQTPAFTGTWTEKDGTAQFWVLILCTIDSKSQLQGSNVDSDTSSRHQSYMPNSLFHLCEATTPFLLVSMPRTSPRRSLLICIFITFNRVRESAATCSF